MVIKRSGALIKPARVPGIGEPESLKVQVMAELMAECAEECAERCDFFAHRGSHPHPNQHGLWAVITEEFEGTSFANPQWSRRKHSNAAVRDAVEVRGEIQELSTEAADIGSSSRLDSGLDRLCKGDERSVLGQIKALDPVTLKKTGSVLSRWGVGDHDGIAIFSSLASQE
jgi:hypothetical protein